MRRKRVDIGEAVARIPSGATLALGGSLLRRPPTALVRALLRHGARDLTALTWANSMAVELLAAAGALRRWEGIYVGFTRFGLAPAFRRAVEEGRLEVADFSESAMVARFRATAMGLAFLPVRGLAGTDFVRRNPQQIREISCPFTHERYQAVAAARADFTLIHGYLADEFGNVQWPVVRDSDDIDPLMAKASRRLIVSVERIVSHEEVCRHPTLTYIPHRWVEAVVEAPFGAHPCACDAFYDEDEAELAAYLEAARDPARLQAYLERTVWDSPSHADYLERLGGREALRGLLVGEPEPGAAS